MACDSPIEDAKRRGLTLTSLQVSTALANDVRRLRLDHGAIAALLVPTPTPAIVTTIRDILTAHNALEEEPGGLYAACDRLLASDADAIVREMAVSPEVRVSQHNDGPGVMAALRRALERAGYRLRDGAED